MNEKEIKTYFEEIINKTVRSIERLEGGLSNLSYKINDAYVIRIPNKYVQPFINYNSELEIINKISELNISERLVHFDIDKGIKISKFIHQSKHYVDTPTDEEILLTAKTLKKLHKSKILVENDFNPLERLEKYKSYANKKERLDGRYERKIIRLVKDRLVKDEKVLCHNDIVRGNLLYKYNKVIIIDWEFASMNNVYFDLASFISENNLNSGQKEKFLKDYYGSKLNNLKKNNVELFIKFNNMLWYYWALMMHKNTNNKIYENIANEKKQLK
jgi:thiamine kinase-like enzyme